LKQAAPFLGTACAKMAQIPWTVTLCPFACGTFGIVTVSTPLWYVAPTLVEGVKTKQQGLHRVYMSPPLIVDKDYTYTVEVQWMDDTGTKRTEKTSFDFLLGEPTKHLQFPLKMTK
jgi:uncharacterized protein (TIGR03000 family)